MSDLICPNKSLNIVILIDLAVLPIQRDILIALTMSPFLAHNLLETLDIDISVDNLVGEIFPFALVERPQLDLQIRRHEEHGTDPTYTGHAAYAMSNGLDLTSREHSRAPAANHDGGVRGHRDPNSWGHFGLQRGERSFILEDDAECTVITMSAAAVAAVRVRGRGDVVAQAEVQIPGGVQPAHVETDQLR